MPEDITNPRTGEIIKADEMIDHDLAEEIARQVSNQPTYDLI